MKTIYTKTMQVLPLILSLLLLSLPVAAQETAKEPTTVILPTGWLWGMMLFFMLVILVLIGVVLYLLQERAKAGDRQAADLLKGIEAGKDLIPIDKIHALLGAIGRRADETANPWDDILAGAIERGVNMILQRSAVPVAAAPAPASPVVSITNNAGGNPAGAGEAFPESKGSAG